MRLSVHASSQIAVELLKKWFPLRLTLHPFPAVYMTTSTTVVMLAEAGTAISALSFLVTAITRITATAGAQAIQFQATRLKPQGLQYAGRIVVCFINILAALLTEYKSVMVRVALWIGCLAGELRTVFSSAPPVKAMILSLEKSMMLIVTV